MKKIYVFLAWITFGLNGYGQSISLGGHAFLESQLIHDSVKVKFTRIAPSYLIDSTYTDSGGNYNKIILTGYYDITFSKNSYVPVQISSIPLYTNTILPDTTLEENGLCGDLSGSLVAGNYIVYCDIYVPTGSTLIISPGTKLRFKANTKLTVNGELTCVGTAADSIIFTRYNDTTYWGGINYLYATSNNILEYCLIEYSKSGGIDLNYTREAVINHSTVRYCGSSTSYTGGISIANAYLPNSYARLDNILIYGNYSWSEGGGIRLYHGNAIINNVIVHDNSSNQGSGGIHNEASEGSISNSLIVNNSGKGFELWNSSFPMRNVTVAGNTGTGIESYDVKISNSIISNNGGLGINNLNTQMSPTIINSDIYSNAGGNLSNCGAIIGNIVTANVNGIPCDGFNNIFTSPAFIDMANENYQLISTSSCIDAGNNDSVFTPTDIQNCIRIWDGNGDGTLTVDIGAYEYSSPASSIQNNKYSENLFEIYPNPSRGIVHVKVMNENSTLEVFDHLGQKIFNKDIGVVRLTDLDLSRLSKGLYFFKFSTDKLSQVKKVVIN
jgi:hypothetical protein